MNEARGRRLAGSGVFALIGRILQIVVSVLTGLLIPLCLAPKDVGLFFLAQALVAAGAVVAQFGFTITAPTLVARARALGQLGRARSTGFRMLVICALLGALVGIVIGTSISALDGKFDHAAVSGLRPLLTTIVLLPAPLALLTVLVELNRATNAIADASFLPIIPGLTLGATVLLFLSASAEISLHKVLLIQLVATSGVVAIGAARLAWRTRSWTGEHGRNSDAVEMLTTGWFNLLTTLSLFLVATVDIWIVGAIGSAVEVAQYGLGIRLAALFLVPLATVNATIVPQIVSNWTHGRRNRLESLLMLTATGATLLAAVAFLVFLAVGRTTIESIWGPVYGPSVAVALVLAFGNLVHTAGGSSGHMLLLLGQQRRAMRITILVSIATIAAAVFGMREFGVVGIAVAYAASNIIRTVLFVRASKASYGIDPSARLISPLRLRAIMGFRH